MEWKVDVQSTTSMARRKWFVVIGRKDGIEYVRSVVDSRCLIHWWASSRYAIAGGSFQLVGVESTELLRCGC